MRLFLWLLVVLLTGCGAVSIQGSSERAAAPSMNRSFLAAQPYPALVVEIDYDADDPPSDYAVAALRRWLKRHVHKPGGIEIRVD